SAARRINGGPPPTPRFPHPNYVGTVLRAAGPTAVARSPPFAPPLIRPFGPPSPRERGEGNPRRRDHPPSPRSRGEGTGRGMTGGAPVEDQAGRDMIRPTPCPTTRRSRRPAPPAARGWRCRD